MENEALNICVNTFEIGCEGAKFTNCFGTKSSVIQWCDACAPSLRLSVI